MTYSLITQIKSIERNPKPSRVENWAKPMNQAVHRRGSPMDENTWGGGKLLNVTSNH